MLKINKEDVPKEYSKLEKKYNNYKEFDGNIKGVLRKYFITEQNNYCPYCERYNS